MVAVNAIPDAALFRRGRARWAHAADPAGPARPRTPADPRWVLAAAAMTALDGGRAAVLAPARRRRLMATAAAMGLREFDAALIIAIVQDAARRGEPLHGGAARSLDMVPVRAAAGSGAGALLAVAAVVGAGWAAVLIALLAR
jgi:hypothetical protein